MITKFYKIFFWSILAISIICGIVYFVFKRIDPCSTKTISKKSSPDRKVEAILIEKNCGATTGFSYHLYITIPNRDIGQEEPVLVADNSEGLSIQWLNAKSLVVSYTNARIFDFTNFWQSRDLDNFQYIVEIRLRPLLDKYLKETDL